MNSTGPTANGDQAGNQGLPIPELHRRVVRTEQIDNRNSFENGEDWLNMGPGNCQGHGKNYNNGYRKVEYTGRGSVPGIQPEDYYNSVHIPQFVPRYPEHLRMNRQLPMNHRRGAENGVQKQVTIPAGEMEQFHNVSKPSRLAQFLSLIYLYRF